MNSEDWLIFTLVHISLVPHCFRVHLGWICKTAISFIHGPVLMQVPVAGATSTTLYARGFCCQYICLTAWLSWTRGLVVGLLYYEKLLGKDFQKTQVWFLGVWNLDAKLRCIWMPFIWKLRCKNPAQTQAPPSSMIWLVTSMGPKWAGWCWWLSRFV